MTDPTRPKARKAIDRLEAMAGAADQARRWKARRNGLLDRGAPSEVRDLSGDAAARADAEASLRKVLSGVTG